MNEPHPIENSYWSIEDLSRYLKVKVKTLYAMLPDIPHYRIGRLIRFNKQEIDLWMEGKKKQGSKTPPERKRHLQTTQVVLDKLIRKTIDRENARGYNPEHGKSDQIKGLGKEVLNGSL